MQDYVHKVQYYETDKMQITHHSNYIRFMEEARIDFLEQLGWGYDQMEREGILSPVLAVTCEYRKSTSFPDVIRIAVAVQALSAVRLTLSYTMRVGEEIVCVGTSTHCFLDRDGRPMRIRRQCPELCRALEALLPGR